MSPDVTFVVPAGLKQKTYFVDLLKMSSRLRSKNWFFQETNMYVEAETAHFFNSWYAHRENFDAALNYIDPEFLPTSQPGQQNRIFIGRSGSRKIINSDEVKGIIKKYDFVYYELEHMPLPQQMSLFASASHIIGTHGAALTNIIFRRNKPAKLLELFPHVFMDPFFFWLCLQYGFEYDALLCKAVTKEPIKDDRHSHFFLAPTADFHIDVIGFEEKLRSFISS